MWPPERNVPFREFSTPPASWRRPAHSPVALAPVPMSETRRRFLSPAAGGRDDFHAIHKVPSGDSPYAKAKHVQLVEKDPSKAVALFWAAINAGDRVDSALKDMAVVMKQLDRSDEAIEAIKSFRYLCPPDSQESLDNVLIDLYKRAGKVEQEIEMLQQMLKNIEEEIAVFGASRTKIARSQGKKVQITVVQEKARILGNLAWAYLQQHNYGFAEQNYRKAMLLEPDKNKQCNLALCLMHMNRIPEAKSLIDEVRTDSGGIEQLDESYARSYERTSEMLSKLESGSQGTKQQEDGSLSFTDNLKTQETAKSRSFMSAFGIGPSSGSPSVDDWRSRGCYFESPVARSDSTDRWTSTPKKNCNASSPAAVLYTQPRIDPRRAIICSQTKEAFGPNAVPRPSDKLLSHVGNLGGRSQSWKNNDPVTDSWRKPLIVVGDVSVPIQHSTATATKSGASDAADNANENCIQEVTFSRYKGKSWADIAEEEEEEEEEQLLLSAAKGCNHDDHDRAFNDENMESNITQMLGGVRLNDSSNTSKTGSGSKERSVRRSLSFEDDKDASSSTKRTRLQVFQDITPYPDSP